MTEEQMKMLIDGLAEQMVKRIYGLEKERDQAVYYADREEDHAVGELARLMTLSALYQDREEYEKCAILKKHIDRLEKIVGGYES